MGLDSGRAVASRSDAVRRAVADELARRAAMIDASDDLVSVTVTVKLQDGPPHVRAVTYEDHSERRRRPRE